MKQPVPKMTALPKACTICDLWMKRGLIPRSHAGIKGFMIRFKAYGQYDPLSYRKNIAKGTTDLRVEFILPK